jgi:hypothetical protein
VETGTLHPEQGERVAHPRRSRKAETRSRKTLYLNLWENLDTIDLIQSERFEYWERKAGRIQYEFRTRISNRGRYWERKAGRIQYKFRTRILNKGRYIASYNYNSSGYNQGPFNKVFHKRQVAKEYSTPINNGLQHENHKK